VAAPKGEATRIRIEVRKKNALKIVTEAAKIKISNGSRLQW
jgi:hypothetical protein